MNAKLTITYFPNQTEDGMALLKEFRAYANHQGLTLTEKLQATQSDFVRACVQQDIVIFDGSIEGDIHNYAIASAQPGGYEHVLVVSRTYLPVNFTGLRIGGAPPYPQMGKSNAEIMTWLQKQITELRSNSIVPRPWFHKNMLGSLATIWGSLEREGKARHAQNNVFISYRSRYYRDEQFQCLIDRINNKAEFGGETRKPYVVPPAQLSMGFMTEQERWQLLVEILHWITAAREIWVYETEDYYRSWWTLAELVMLAYLRQRHDGRGPRLRIYNKKTDSLTDASADYLPPMSFEQRRRMDRYMSVSDRHTMAPETDKRMRELSQGKWTQEIDYFRDHAFSEAFTRDLILDCFECDKSLTSLTGFDYDDFLYLRGGHFTRFLPTEVENLTQDGRGTVNCLCGIQQQFVMGPSQYIWWPTRMGRATGPAGKAIATRPSYLFVQ